MTFFSVLGFALHGVYNPEQGSVGVQVLTQSDRLLKQFIRAGNSDLQLQIPSNWPKGMLLVQVSIAGGTSETLKVLNQ